MAHHCTQRSPQTEDVDLRRRKTSTHAGRDGSLSGRLAEEAPDDVSGIAEQLAPAAKGMSQVAKEAGLSRESLYRAAQRGSNPSFATVLKVAGRSGPAPRPTRLSRLSDGRHLVWAYARPARMARSTGTCHESHSPSVGEEDGRWIAGSPPFRVCWPTARRPTGNGQGRGSGASRLGAARTRRDCSDRHKHHTVPAAAPGPSAKAKRRIRGAHQVGLDLKRQTGSPYAVAGRLARFRLRISRGGEIGPRMLADLEHVSGRARAPRDGIASATTRRRCCRHCRGRCRCYAPGARVSARGAFRPTSQRPFAQTLRLWQVGPGSWPSPCRRARPAADGHVAFG